MTQDPPWYPHLFARMRRASGAWGLVVVRGRSMQPTLYDGDRLLVRHGAVPRPGRLAVVRLPDGVLAVKRVTMRRPDGWWVERDNPDEGVDSWLVGAVPDGDVVAVVRARVWPRRRRRL
ncbi:MAG TPA: S24 family peptidase [Nocardioidaceae bacterium]|jgi:phage repressor protein C with HTH and peptisase S24 domain|nr:S24 family peptidase [Nocardioidaceae bacterium]